MEKPPSIYGRTFSGRQGTDAGDPVGIYQDTQIKTLRKSFARKSHLFWQAHFAWTSGRGQGHSDFGWAAPRFRPTQLLV
jgi:hypothetical protein